jgi:phytanoyl-CoA dioxygenase PhyH
MATSRQTISTTEEQRAQFERDGFLVLDPEIPDEVLEGAKQDLADKYSFEDGPPVVDEFGVRYIPAKNPRIAYAWKVSDNVRDIAIAPKVLSTLEDLYGMKPLPFQTLNFPYGTEQAPHVDGVYFNSYPFGSMCGVWVALEDVDMDNGPLVYYPGSHKLPIPSPDDIGDPDRSEYPDWLEFYNQRVIRYQNHVAGQVESHGFEPRYGTIRKGQALLWAAHLIHGGSPQKDTNRTRHSQVTHYYFEGDFRHCGPLQINGDRMHWDYPGWISEDAPIQPTTDVVAGAVEANVPAGTTVVVGTGGAVEYLDFEGRTGLQFPQRDGEYVARDDVPESEMIEMIEKLKADGADYFVVPATQLPWFNSKVQELKYHLEDRHPTVFRDGGICIIYDLNETR